LQAATEGYFDPVQERQIHAHLPIPSDLSSRSFHGCAIRLSTDKFTIEATFTNGLQVRLFYRAHTCINPIQKIERSDHPISATPAPSHCVEAMRRGAVAANRLRVMRQFRLAL
jgi:hypothetical protein